jgi:hypothetical protein
VSDDRQKMENSLQYLGYLMGGEVRVQLTGDGQEILIPQSDTGQRLACLLGFGKTQIIRKGDERYWLVPHSQQVDDLLVELIDLFISIRYAHPTMVQLEIVLEPDRP